MKAKGFILELDHPSPSGRIYSKEVMKNAIKEFNERPNPKFGGCVDDVAYPGIYLDVSKISHKINDVYIEDNKVIADIDILDNDNGKMVKKFLELDEPLYLNPIFMIGENKSDVKLLYTTISQYPSIDENCKLEKYEKD